MTKNILHFPKKKKNVNNRNMVSISITPKIIFFGKSRNFFFVDVVLLTRNFVLIFNALPPCVARNSFNIKTYYFMHANPYTRFSLILYIFSDISNSNH